MTANPQTADPHTAGPHTADPQTAEPQTAEPQTAKPDKLLDVRNLTVNYHRRGAPALREASLDIRPGETVALVGESGSGKSTLGRAVLGLTPASDGTITFAGEDITRASARRRVALSREIQAVFQDPNGSLNPARTVGQTLAEPLLVHERPGRAATQDRIAEVLAQVGLPASAARRYPRQFSGGQRQRIAIARALVMRPRLIVCDEPVSALDLSVQAQILNLFLQLQRDTGVSYLFISHDLAVVRHLAHRLVVLFRGDVVESGVTEDLYHHPGHAYTRRLLSAVHLADEAGDAAAPATV
jgi:ABC-type glutathione transport system ATPase component